MGQIFVATLAGVSSKEVGQLWLWSDCQILMTRWQKGGGVFWRKMNVLNEKV